MTGSAARPLFTMSPVTKTFGQQAPALDGVSLELEAATIHGLIGRNGSGKSTLIKILSGYHAPDTTGWIDIAGRRASLPIPPDVSRKLGLGFLHQDLGMLPDASVLENLRIGRYKTAPGWRIRWRTERATARQALATFDLDIPVDTPIGRLSSVERGLVAVVRGFLDLEESGGGVLVLDEPTAFLARDDVTRLFNAMRQLVQTGNSVLFVSHRIDEVLAITDRIAVLRDGKLVANVNTSETNESELIHLILGRALHGYYPPHHHEEHRRPVLTATHLTGEIAQDVNLTLTAGEIVGATGIRGMGHEELPYLLFGAKKSQEGSIHIGSSDIDAGHINPRSDMRKGVVFIPADRKNVSGAPAFTLEENVSLPVLGRFFRGMHLHHRDERRSVTNLLREFGVQPDDPKALLGELSGGNQQKALLAKWFQRKPSVLLFHEPTAGVDVGAKKEIFARITQVAADGAAVLIVSEEFEDLAHLCDKVYVFNDGHMSAEPLTGDDLTEEAIAERCYRAVSDRSTETTDVDMNMLSEAARQE